MYYVLVMLLVVCCYFGAKLQLFERFSSKILTHRDKENDKNYGLLLNVSVFLLKSKQTDLSFLRCEFCCFKEKQPKKYYSFHVGFSEKRSIFAVIDEKNVLYENNTDNEMVSHGTNLCRQPDSFQRTVPHDTRQREAKGNGNAGEVGQS